jgi:autotransporter adhesin
MAVGTGLYRGQTALAIGYQRKVGSRATVTIGGSTAGGTEYNVGVGAGYGW